MADTDKTVFISYRRRVDAYLARAVFANLKEHGYDVFMDVESIDSGTFDTIILNQIAARAHFIVILTPGTLERVKDTGDWLRIEIERALELERNIVPVMTSDFSFGDSKPYLTGTLKNLPRYNGVTIHHDYFDDAMKKLRERFLKKPVYASITPTPSDESDTVRGMVNRLSFMSAPTLTEPSMEENLADYKISRRFVNSGLIKPIQENRATLDELRIEDELARLGFSSVAAPDILTVTTPIQMELVRVPAGEFMMGSDPAIDKDALENEQPQHRLSLTEFYIGKYPVTNAQYSLFVKATDYGIPRHWENDRVPKGKGDHPVVYVSWYDALAFCEWMRGVTGKKFHLPSEAEWEYAARGGPLSKGYLYAGGDDPDEVGWYDKNSGNDTHPTGEKKPNELGIYDMSGNVYERTRSLWGEDRREPDFKYPYDPRDGREDIGALQGIQRVSRGGSFGNIHVGMRCAFRARSFPDYMNDRVGIRVVVSPSDSDL